MANGSKKIDVSVIVPVVDRSDDLEKLFELYSESFRKKGFSFEFIFVVDGSFNKAFQILKDLRKKHPEIKILKFAKNFFESIALMVGFQHAQGETIFTLASYMQVEPNTIDKVFDKLNEGNDLVITRRFPRNDSLINRIQSRVFHLLLMGMTGFSFKDIACGLRAMRREVALSLDLTGDLHRFIPILAFQKGYKVAEVDGKQCEEDQKVRFYGFGIYIRRVIDIISLFFLIKFTRKPLRFFGLIGVTLLSFGAVITFYLGLARIFGSVALAGRPMLLLGLLLLVLGIQIISLGLLGELVIFTSARDVKEYHIEEIIE